MPGNIREGPLGNPENGDTSYTVKRSVPHIRLKRAWYSSVFFEFPRFRFQGFQQAQLFQNARSQFIRNSSDRLDQGRDKSG